MRIPEKPTLLGRKAIVERLVRERDPKRKLVVSPILSSSQLQAASLDVRLGPEFRVIKIGKITHLDPLRDNRDVEREVRKYTDAYKILQKRESFILHPNEFVLGATLEYVSLPVDLAARLEGRSSWGRLGVLIHATAGYIDPGFRGNITLELKNMGKVPIPLFPGVRVGQLSFFQVENDRAYQGKYQNSFGIRSSAYFRDVEYERLRRRPPVEEMQETFMEVFSAVDDRVDWVVSPNQDRMDLDTLKAAEAAYRMHTAEGDDDLDDDDLGEVPRRRAASRGRVSRRR